MSLLVEYSLAEGQAEAQRAALRALVSGLKEEGCEGFSYSGYATPDPARFLAVFEFEDEAGKQRFLDSRAFAAYRDGARERFTAPPKTTEIELVATTR